MIPIDAEAVDRVGAGDPAWLGEERLQARAHFEKLAMPSSAEELWRYVELDFAIDDYGLTESPGAAEPSPLEIPEATLRAEIIDGHTVNATAGEGRVWLGSLRRAAMDHGDLLRSLTPHGVPADIDKFAAAHRAFGGDGVLLHVGRGAIAGPVHVDVVAATSRAISFPRVIVAAEETAEASVIVHLRSADDVDAVVVPQFELHAGAAANLKVTVVQSFGRATTSIAHSRAVVGRDASVVLAEAGLGGKLSRLHLTVDLEGQGSSADVIGAYFGDEEQVLDYRYFMHHAGLNTRSDMFLKGAVEDDALSVFTGMIRIDESAQRTDAFQTNRNLILSEGAAAQSVPNLEILANDVRCGHGSTMGPLDPEQRYYLMSRGLDAERADRLQVRGFFQEALARFPHAEVAGPVGEWINTKFIAAQEEGRL